MARSGVPDDAGLYHIFDGASTSALQMSRLLQSLSLRKRVATEAISNWQKEIVLL
jgi:hypothetical protein